MWRPKDDVGDLPISLQPYSLIQASQSNPELTDLASFPSQLTLGILCLQDLSGITGGPPCPLRMYVDSGV